MKPILFNTEMVRAIQNGTKTATRRVVKEPYYIDDEEASRVSGLAVHRGTNMTDGMPYPDQPYRPGDILYVRETWANLLYPDGHMRYVYRATDTYPFGEKMVLQFRWHPSIHMPREAARIFLRVTDVRVERLQDITPERLRAEGMHLFVTPSECKHMMDRFGAVCDYERKKKDFSALWNSTIKPKDRALYGWDANPWVWVIEFERCEKPEGV